jgi:hypothetical protein
MTADRDVFSVTIDAVFVHSVLMSVAAEGNPVLNDEIKEYFNSNGLQLRSEMISKVSAICCYRVEPRLSDQLLVRQRWSLTGGCALV